ncbi:MAG: O-antigen ligase family protein [Anaerolineae bacterium]|nr:O-antigen ligase family protein [Candidatus Roseilinea sp.]MDW8448420.1 O-antigen ligase family protein [Anaerolineae bacterium]
MRYIALVIVLGLSAICAYLVVESHFDPAFLLAGLAAIAAGGLIYRLGRFEYGLLAVLLAAGLVNFFTLPTGRDSRVVISLAISLLLLAIWGYQLVFANVTHVRLRPSPINKPLLAFVSVNIIAYAWSQLMRDPILYVWPSFPVVQVAALIVNIALPLMALLVVNKVKEVKWLKWMTAIIIGLGTLNIVSQLFNLPTVVLIHNGSRGIFGSWVVIVAYALVLFQPNMKRWQRVALLVLIAASIYFYFFRNRLWLSGWLPMFVGIGVLTFFRSRRLFVVFCIGLLVIAFDRLDDLYKTIILANVNEGGLERLELWEKNIQHVLNHPIFGMGPAGYAVYNMTYHPEDARSTHNNYFDVLAQSGIIGLMLFVALLSMFVRICWQTQRLLQGRRNFEEAFANAAFAGCLAAMVAMMLGDWVLPFAYNQTISGFDNAVFTWMMLGGGVALYHLVTASRSDSPRALPVQHN